VYARPLPPGVYEAEAKFGMEKLGVVYVYPYSNMLALVCCGKSKVGAEPSMVVWLWKWFIGWVEGFGIVVPPTDVPLVCGIVLVKLTAQEEKKD
jgi:hypothetical protein